MRAPAMALAAVFAVLVAGCAQPPEPATGPDPIDEHSRTARGGGADGEEDNRTAALLGSVSGGALPPGTYPLPLQAPVGGANDVEWMLEVVPAAAFTLDGVQGPGCQTNGWFTSVIVSGTTGTCAPVAEGTHEWGFTLNAPVASYRVDVHGQVWESAHGSSNATEP